MFPFPDQQSAGSDADQETGWTESGGKSAKDYKWSQSDGGV